MLWKIVVGFVVICSVSCSFPPEEDPNLFEGDMILSPAEREAIKKTTKPDVPLAATKQPWPRVIPYDFYSLKGKAEARKAIKGAIEEFHKHTCLRFIPRTTERAYLQFEDGKGCSSMVGYVPGRKNSIALGKICWTVGIAIHEIMHSLGFHHEQSRPDRDQHIIVHHENVLEYATDNFKKYDYTKIDSLGEPYDFESIMHYKGTTFAKHHTLAITTKDPNKQHLIGQREKLSDSDIRQLNKLYKCDQAPPMTIPTVPTLNPNCFDKYGHCEKYLDRCKLPDTDSFAKWVQSDCRLTCNLCGETNPSGKATTPQAKPVTTAPPNRITTARPLSCRDELQSCKYSYCTISSWKYFVQKNCRKTCSLC